MFSVKIILVRFYELDYRKGVHREYAGHLIETNCLILKNKCLNENKCKCLGNV